MDLSRLLDIPEYFDPIGRIEGAISTFMNADWKGAWRRRGIIGLVGEFLACIVSSNSPTIKFRRNAGWSGSAVERLLACYGVKLWDRGLAGDNLYFCVKRRQVKWAEYILLCAGVPVTSKLHITRSGQGSMPVAWTARGR